MDYAELLKVYYEGITKIINNPSIDLSNCHDGCMGAIRLIDKDLLITNFANYFKRMDNEFDWKKFLDKCGY